MNMTKEQYIDKKYDEYLRYWADIGLGFGPVAVLSLIPLDYVVTPANFVTFLVYRVITAGVLFLLYLGSKIRMDRGYQSFILIVAGTAVSMMVAGMIAKFHGHQSPYFAGFILTAIFVSGVLPTLFRASIIASGIVYAVYLIPLLLYDRITDIAFFASANFLILACISTMLLMRYFCNKHLFREFGLQFDVEQYKNTLEERVKQRTTELSRTIGELETEMLERKRAEAEQEILMLQQRNLLKKISVSRKEWLATFDSITDMISIHDLDFTIVKANKAFARYFGSDIADVLNKKCYEFFNCKAVHAPDLQEKSSPSECKPAITEISDPDSGRILRFSVFPYYAMTGELVGTVHIARDITEERDREMRLIMSERLASLGQMASGIAHEINNPLATIAGCAEGLINRVKQGRIDTELFESYLATIREEVMRCKTITTGMLAVVRNSSYETKDIDLHELIDKAIELIAFQGRLRDVDVVKNYAEGSLQLHGSEGELKQAILAILTNALDAMQERGSLRIGTAIRENDAIISIGDTGPGISQEHIRRIFDPFFSLKSDRGGTGLGLSIANRIIGNHHGHITVDSVVGKGATFAIILPLKNGSTSP